MVNGVAINLGIESRLLESLTSSQSVFGRAVKARQCNRCFEAIGGCGGLRASR